MNAVAVHEAPVNPLPTVLVLASGRGERFRASGGRLHKLDAMLGDRTVLQHTLDAVAASGLAWHLERADHAGMGDAIAAAVRATSESPGWLILPGDMPLVRPATIRLVAEALAAQVAGQQRAAMLRVTFKGQRGHPVAFGPDCREALLKLSGDRGAAPMLARHAAMEIEVDDPGCQLDVDTLDDLTAAAQALQLRAQPS